MTVNNPNRASLKAWFDIAENDSYGAKYEFLNDLFYGFYDEGAYASDWSSVSLPSGVENGRWVLRYNTDTSTLRLYVYVNSAWKYITFT